MLGMVCSFDATHQFPSCQGCENQQQERADQAITSMGQQVKPISLG